MVVRELSASDGPAGLPGDLMALLRPGALLLVSVILLAGMLPSPAGAALSMAAVTDVKKIGDVVTLTGVNTENSTTFLFLTGPYLDENGVMLTNTSRPAKDGYLDSAPVSSNYSWSFVWDTLPPEVNLNEGAYVIYAVTAPLPRGRLTGHTYVAHMITFQGSVKPVTTATTATATPVPTWTMPPAGTEVEASSSPSDEYPGRFDGDLIPYEVRRGEGDYDIYLYNITSGKTTAVATGPAIQGSPSVSGGKVVYSAYEVHQFNRSDADIFVFDVASGTTERLTLPGDQVSPRMYGNLLAWQDEPPGRSSVNVVLHDLMTSVQLKVPARTWAYSPDLSGGKVIWIDDPSGPAVFVYDLSEKTIRRVTNRTGIKGIPALDGDRIAWADTRSDYAQIYVLDLVTMAETQVTTDDVNHFTPAISGDRVVWVDFRNGERDIYLYDLAARREQPVTTNLGDQVGPQIAGCTVAWADNRNGSYDVYYRRIPGCTPTPGPAPVSLEPEAVTTPPLGTTPVTPDITSSAETTATIILNWTPPSPQPTTKSPVPWGIPVLAIGAVLVVMGWPARSR
jgi:beta propeller repeat protein